MDREEFIELVRSHHVNGTWCDGCSKQVGRQANHLADLLFAEGVDYLLAARLLD